MRIREIVTAGTLVTLCGCSTLTSPGHLTLWSNGMYAPVGDASSVQIYDLGYDSAADQLILEDKLQPHDTIGVIILEADENTLCNGPCTNYDEVKRLTWQYKEDRVSRLQKRAWEIGGTGILLASPKIQRQGVWRLVSDASRRASLIGDEEAARSLRSKIGSTWLIYAAYVIRWVGPHVLSSPPPRRPTRHELQATHDPAQPR